MTCWWACDTTVPRTIQPPRLLPGGPNATHGMSGGGGVHARPRAAAVAGGRAQVGGAAAMHGMSNSGGGLARQRAADAAAAHGHAVAGGGAQVRGAVATHCTSSSGGGLARLRAADTTAAHGHAVAGGGARARGAAAATRNPNPRLPGAGAGERRLTLDHRELRGVGRRPAVSL